jgi:predicted Zn-dependent protease
MKTPCIMLTHVILGVVCLAGAAPEKRPVTEVISKADAVLKKSVVDNVAAATEVDIVFGAANRLLEEKDLDKSEYYFVEGLKLSPWDMEQQLAFAKLLEMKGENEKAVRAAQIVFQTSERQNLLEESGKIAKLALPNGIKPLPAEAQDDKVFCFVRFGPVDDWIIQCSGELLSETLGASVYLYQEAIPLSAPHRSYYDRWAQRLKTNVVWEHPFIQKQMRDIGIKNKESATVDQTLELLARAAVAQGDKDPRGNFAKLKQDAKDRDQQWDANRLLEQLALRLQRRKNVVFIGITGADIYGGDSNYLFGLAPIGSGNCLFSYRRYTAAFNQERENQRRFLGRIHKQMLSSVGFALGIPRPTDPRSARSYPNSLQDHDLKGTWLSPECIKGFENALQHPLPDKTKEESNKALHSTSLIAP